MVIVSFAEWTHLLGLNYAAPSQASIILITTCAKRSLLQNSKLFNIVKNSKILML